MKDHRCAGFVPCTRPRAAIFAVVQELTVGGLSLTSFTSGQSAIAMPQPHPSAHYERARGTDVINVTDRSRVGTVFFLTNIFVKGWGSLPTALSTTLLSTTERSGGSSLPERSVVVETQFGRHKPLAVPPSGLRCAGCDGARQSGDCVFFNKYIC